MKVSYSNGRIVTDGYLYEDVPYDVSADNLSVCFDGKGGITKYLSVNNEKNYSTRSMFSVYKDGERIGAYTKKQTKMAGRMQTISLLGDGYQLEMKQFVAKADNAVFVEMSFFADKSTEFTMLYGAGNFDAMPAFSCDIPYVKIEDNMFFLWLVLRFPHCLKCSDIFYYASRYCFLLYICLELIILLESVA